MLDNFLNGLRRWFKVLVLNTSLLDDLEEMNTVVENLSEICDDFDKFSRTCLELARDANTAYAAIAAANLALTMERDAANQRLRELTLDSSYKAR